MKKVLLLNMPFVSPARPAIGISLLKAQLSGEGIECRTAYPNLMFAEEVGLDRYGMIDEQIGPRMFLGDWLFAQHLFGKKLDLNTYIATLGAFLGDDARLESLLDTRRLVGPFLARCMERLQVEKYDIIGFTTTFQQTLASLALAFEIKRRYPDRTIVLGGANCEGVMGIQLLKSFPWVDYVCRGESETSFPSLIRALDTGQTPSGLRGIVYRDHGIVLDTGPPTPVAHMDLLPVPDFDDYFAALQGSSLAGRFAPSIPIENSRGCWWGAKSHCTFCGLNGTALEFRTKSASRILEELQFLTERYGSKDFVAVDNILDQHYFRDVLPRLKEEGLGLSLFYETKSNLKRDQVRLLSEAGVRAIQPGIESLNTHVLGLMRKGTTAFRNIELLKWCREFHVEAAWNFLYGFPGETAEDYRQTEGFIESLHHLAPPGTVSSVRLDRFSPYFSHPADFGLTAVRPFDIYNLIYPLGREEVSNLAYFFQYAYRDQPEPESYVGRVLEKIDIWKNSLGGRLTKRYGGEAELMLTDTRATRRHSRIALNGIQRDVYDYCDTAKSLGRLVDYAGSRYHLPLDFQSWLQQFLGQLVEWKVMIEDKDHYLSLAVCSDAA